MEHRSTLPVVLFVWGPSWILMLPQYFIMLLICSSNILIEYWETEAETEAFQPNILLLFKRHGPHLKCFKYEIFTYLVRLLLVVDASPWNVRHAQGGNQSAREHAPHVLRPPHVEGGAPRLPHQGVPCSPGHLAITRVQPPHTGWQQNVSFQDYKELFLISTPRGPQVPATEFH